MEFGDLTFIDAMVRRRQHYRIDSHGDKTRICWLLADAIMSAYNTDRERLIGLMEWTCKTVPHVGGVDYRGRTDFFRLHALDIIARGFGACEATSEVFITLAWLAGYPARRIAISSPPDVKGRLGHTVGEVYIPQDGKWSFIDPDLHRYFILEDGTLGNAMELREYPEITQKCELQWKEKKWKGELAFLNNYRYLDDRGCPRYQTMFQGEIQVQEGTYSLDGFYGRWIKLSAEKVSYLYGGPKHPDVRKLLEKRLPFVYTLPSTHRKNYFNYLWDLPLDDGAMWDLCGPEDISE